MENINELKNYLVSLEVGIKDVKYIDNNHGEYIVIVMNNGYEYEPINVTANSKYAVLLDIVTFMRKHF